MNGLELAEEINKLNKLNLLTNLINIKITLLTADEPTEETKTKYKFDDI